MTPRYSRQILFSGIGKEGQQCLNRSRVVLVGCGALGTVSAEMLVRAGVGRLRVIDRDFVEESNLQRQSLFTEADAADSAPKAKAAEKALRAVNSEVKVEGIIADVTFENIEQLCADGDLIVDGTDNFEIRFLLNDFAVRWQTPWVYGAAVGSYGTGLCIVPGQTPCLRCMFEQPPPADQTETCDTVGVIGPVIHAVSSFQVSAALRVLVGAEVPPHMLQVDVWRDDWRVFKAPAEPVANCRCCGQRQFEYLKGDRRPGLTRLCGRDAVQISPPAATRLNLKEIADRLGKSAEIQANAYLIRARLDGREVALFSDGRAIIKGTDDFAEARALYARYIGS